MKIVKIENTAICKEYIPGVDCCDDSYVRFKPFIHNAYQIKREVVEFDNLNGGISTCPLIKSRTMQLNFDVRGDNRCELVKTMEQLFSPYSCIENCYPIELTIEDDCGDQYVGQFTAGDYLPTRTCTIDSLQYTLHMCGTVWKGVRNQKCCGEVTRQGCFSFPLPIPLSLNEIEEEIVVYSEANHCADVTIEANLIDASYPTFHVNGAYYGFNKANVNGTIVFDSQSATLYENGTLIGVGQRIRGSNPSKMKLCPGVNKIAVTSETGGGEYCVSWTNDRT